MTGFLRNSAITIPAVKGILSWFWVSTRITSQKLWWSSPHHPWRFDMTYSFCILRLYYTFIPLWLKWGHWSPVDHARLSLSCRQIGKNYDGLCMIGECDDSMIYDQQWQRGHYSVLCYKYTEKHIQATSQASVIWAAWWYCDPGLNKVFHLRDRWNVRHQCSDQRGNEIWLLLPKTWSISYKDRLHSTLHVFVFCHSSAIFPYHWNFWLFRASFLHIFHSSESMLKYG